MLCYAIQNLWVKELRYISVHILQSRTFKCSLSNHRKTVYRSANHSFYRLRSDVRYRQTSDRRQVALPLLQVVPCYFVF